MSLLIAALQLLHAPEAPRPTLETALNKNYHVATHESFQNAVDAFLDEMPAATIPDLLVSCREVVSEAQGLVAELRAQDPSRSTQAGMALGRLQWVRCAAVLELMARSGEGAWVPEVEALFHEVRATALVMGHGPFRLDFALTDAAGQAYLELVLRRLPLEQWATAYRDQIVNGEPFTARGRAFGLLMQEVRAAEAWTPELLRLFHDPDARVRTRMLGAFGRINEPTHPDIQDAVIGLIDDPDPALRDAVVRMLTTYPLRGDELVPALLRYLRRGDASDEARGTVTEALRIRGWEAVPGPDGVEARRLE